MQTMPGMTQQQRPAAGDPWRQFQDRLFGNRQQQSYGQPTSQPSQPKSSQPSVTGWPTQSQQPAKPAGGAPDMSAYRPPTMGQSPSRRPLNQGYGRQPAAPGYGGGWGPDGIRSADFRDRDGDGVDDRDQTGPGAPSNPRNPGAAQPIQQPSRGMPYDPARDPSYRDVLHPTPGSPGSAPGWSPFAPPLMGGDMAYRQPPQQQGAPFLPDGLPRQPDGSLAPPTVAMRPVRDPQAEIDRLKQMGTWDSPRNAKARERLLQQKHDYDTLPAGYFRAPDGSVQQDMIIRGGFEFPMQQPAMGQPGNTVPQGLVRATGQPRFAPQRPPIGMQAGAAQPPSQGMPNGQGPTGFPTPVQDMFTFGGFTPAPPPPRPTAPPPVEAAWYPMQAAQSGQRVAPERLGEDYGFDENLRVDRRVQQEEQRRYGDPLHDDRRGQIAKQERDITQRLQDQVFAGPRAERDAAIAAQEAEHQRRMDQRYGTPGFTQQAVGWDGSVVSPQQNMAQRDAFIQRLNDARTPVAAAAGVYNQGMAPTPPPLNRDFASMWSQAGNMVANGWTNPLAGLFG